MLAWWVAVALSLLSVFVFLLLQRWRSLADDERNITKAAVGNVLLITAHPDDECMFFAPTLLTLTQTIGANSTRRVCLLCLSEGDYYGEGNVRRHELTKSATILGLQSNDVRIINDRGLPDSPTVKWSIDIVGKYILETVKQKEIQTIITFDERGVSGHANHIAICNAVKGLQQQHILTKAGVERVFLLESTGIVRKYIGWLDLIWSQLVPLPTSTIPSISATVNMETYFKARRAMQAHKSQYIWFRRLYIIFSRYMITNSFQELTAPHNS